MGSYRVVVRHGGFWRGVAHKWTTVYPFQGNLVGASIQGLLNYVTDFDSDMCYGGGPNKAGIMEGYLYNAASGGVPIATIPENDFDTPATWFGYNATGWADAAEPQEQVLETALQVEWPTSLSSTGKPISLRKWYHAVKESAGGFAAADLSSADHTALVAKASSLTTGVQAFGVVYGTSSRSVSGPATVNLHYGNHQMPKGRRRTIGALQKELLKLQQEGSDQGVQAN